jgi:hypothetical protein
VALCTPVLLDCRGRREKRREWQPRLTPHTCMGVWPPSFSLHVVNTHSSASRCSAEHRLSRWACAHTVRLCYELSCALMPKALSQVLEGALLRLFI